MSALPAAAATLPDEARRAAWLADRRTCITGTDIAALLGLSKFSSPIRVWLDKKGLAESTENEAMRWGKRLERPILEAYSDAQGVPLEFADPYTLHRCPSFPLLGVSLDAIRLTEDGAPVDAKNTRTFGPEWGPEGTDQIPIWYQAQLAGQMMVTGAPFADLAVLFSGQEFRSYRVFRDEETEGMIREKITAWWERHIIGDVPPDVDGSDSASDYLAKRFRRNTDRILEPTEELAELVARLKDVKGKLKAIEDEKALLENQVKAAIGEAEGIRGLCTWKNNKDGEAVNWEAVARAYAGTPSFPQILAQFTTIKPGARVLRLK